MAYRRKTNGVQLAAGYFHVKIFEHKAAFHLGYLMGKLWECN